MTKEEAVDTLIQKAEKLYDEMEFEQALATCQKVLKTSPQNTKALGLCANSLMELDQDEDARNILTQLVELEPDNPEAYDRYLQLGQLSSELEALNYYKKGIELLQGRMEHVSDQVKEELKIQLADAYASIANLYMDELCDEEHAEQEAKKHLDLCLKVHPTSESGSVGLCTYLKITAKPEEAKKVILESYSRWGPLLNQYCQKLEDDAEPDEQLFQQLPPFEEMFNAAKLLVELKAAGEAEEALTNLLMIDHPDLTVELLYVLANYFIMRNKDEPESTELLYAARKYLQEMIELAEERPHDSEMVKHAQELLEDLIEKLGPMSDSEDEEIGSDYESEDDDV